MSSRSTDQIFSKVAEIIHELFEIPMNKITLESRLYDDLDLDSIDAVDLIVRLQEFVEQRIEPAQFKGVRTVADVVAAAESILTGQSNKVHETN